MSQVTLARNRSWGGLEHRGSREGNMEWITLLFVNSSTVFRLFKGDHYPKASTIDNVSIEGV